MTDRERLYRDFEAFEREELRRMETLGASVDEMIDSLFAGPARSASPADDEE